MNVVHLEDEPWDSGIAHYALTLAAEQARRGHRVSFWGASGSPLVKEAAARGLPTRSWPAGPPGWLELPALRRELAALAPAIVNAHTGSAHAVALICAPKGAAVIRTRGDARPVASTSLTRWAAGRTAAFIAANAAIETQLEAAFPGTPARLVPQGIEGPEDAAPMPGMPFVGMIARMDPVKGHEILLDCAQALKPLVPGLRILCAGEGPQLQRLGWRLKPQGLDGTVRFLGRVPDKWTFLAGCRLGVVASLASEAVSRAALEWMAAARPVIASNVGGLPDLVEDGVTGLLVPPGDAGALAGAVKSLLDDPARAEEMGRAARARWEEQFSLAPFYRLTEAVYEEAIHALSR
ncbi:MAG TPA: glycosyltransferase family 4 protein [Elusimicrobiota bacterium]|nr:glycosyltransferase family 4 protein [Elusimicrobiota bacterium]